MVSVYEYFDYRKLLKDLFEDRKKTNRFFSYRVLAETAGFSSAGFFTKILQGAVNISSQMAIAFAKAFHLTKIETKYFEALVSFNQAKTHDRRREHFEEVLALRRSKVDNDFSENYKLFSQWYYVVIRDLLEFYPFKGNFKELGNMLQPPVGFQEAKKAIETLEKLGYIKKKADGYCRTNVEITPEGKLWEPVAYLNSQLCSVDLVKYAIKNMPAEALEASSITLNISGKSFDLIKNRINKMRQELLEIAQNDANPDRIYRVNLHFFPVSKSFDKTIGAGELIEKGKRGRRPLGVAKKKS